EVVRRYNFDMLRLVLPDGARIVKVASSADPSAIVREVAIAELLARHGLPAPIVEHHDPSGARFGRAFVVLDVQSEISLMERLGDPTGAPRLVAAMGVLLARVHSIALPPSGAPGSLPLARRDATAARTSLG